MMIKYVASSLRYKNAVNGEYSLPALEVPWLFFAQGYISGCGDARYE